MNHLRKRKGFTIVELVIVIAVIAILAAVLIPTFSSVVENSNRSGALSECRNAYTECTNLYMANFHAQLPDGLVFTCNDYYFAGFDGKLYELPIGNDENSVPGRYLTYVQPSGGVVTELATARDAGLSYILVGADDGAKALIFNRYSAVDVDGSSKTVYFLDEDDSSCELPKTYYTSASGTVLQVGGAPVYGVPALDEVPVSNLFYRPDNAVIKNIIFMIPDGGGFDNLTLAGQVKAAALADGKDRLNGARTKLTTDTLSCLGTGYNNITGLYLDNFLIGTATTLLNTAHGTSFITDSSAAGTALSSGYKTLYCQSGIDESKQPRASLTELAQLSGMSTGIVTTKSFADATPMAFFTAHSIYRYEYQDNTLQALRSGVDVAIVEGTQFGDILSSGGSSSHPSVSAASMNYRVAESRGDLASLAADPSTKRLWGALLGVNNYSNAATDYDLAADHIEYDSCYDIYNTVNNPTLLEMTQAALQVLGTNINNPKGFFLMVEGGALDNAAEGGSIRPAIGEALAFDESFAYCVKWAKEHGDNTLVIAVPDHDSGGFYGVENSLNDLIDLIIDGSINGQAPTYKSGISFYQNNISAEIKKFNGGHTDMAVPIYLYAPQSVRGSVIANMGLPSDAAQDKARLAGKPLYYTTPHSADDSINYNYNIQNSAIAPAIAKSVGLATLQAASDELFVEVCRYRNGVIDPSGPQLGTLTFGNDVPLNTYHYHDVTFTSADGKLVVQRNSTTGTLDGRTVPLGDLGNKNAKSLYVLQAIDNGNPAPDGSFYLPLSILKQAGLK